MSSENSKILDPHRLLLLLNPMDKTNLKISDKYILYQILAFAIHLKIWTKSYKKNKKIKISAPTRIDKFELPEFELTTCLYQIFKII